ncbi:MAG: type II toxin-antitoxin system Phd/YefM family antitoxin [Gemmatimonadetes bacterium]|nr:type II toxin-antitoxin system Phd/YefM family antitoxin [Gemmatimonadota bacterium]
MIQSMPIAEARKVLNQLPDRFAVEPEASAFAVTRRGQPVLALMPWSLYQGIVETLEVLGDEAECAALREGIRQIEAGERAVWEGQ